MDTETIEKRTLLFIDKTKIAKNNSRQTTSYRVQVPSHVRDLLHLTHSDQIEWKTYITTDGDLYSVVTKAEE